MKNLYATNDLNIGKTLHSNLPEKRVIDSNIGKALPSNLTEHDNDSNNGKTHPSNLPGLKSRKITLI